MTKDEFIPKIFDALGYQIKVEKFSDTSDTITKSEAIRLLLEGMGWDFAISAVESLYILPDFSEKDLLKEMFQNITPALPETILSHLDEAFTVEDLTPLREWIKKAQKNVSWKGIYHSKDTTLTIIKRGIGNPSGPANGDIKNGKNEPLYIASLSIPMARINSQIATAVMIGSKKAPLSRIAEENYGVIGGINGGYFAGAKPIGILRRQGHMDNNKFWPHRSAFGWNSKGEIVFVDGKEIGNISTTKGLDKYTEILQAGPLLIKNGEISPNTENVHINILDRRHPRTLVGYNKNRVIWCVIDGRDNMHSVGTTIEETKKLCLHMGMTEALNLDGGGSSSLLWQGQTLTLPSNSNDAERPIPYAILFFQKGSGVRD